MVDSTTKKMVPLVQPSQTKEGECQVWPKGRSKEIALDDPALSKMTEREKQVFTLTCKGLTSRKCAAVLGISVRTVEIHRANIIHKYQVKNIAELVYQIRSLLRDERRDQDVL